MAVQGFKVFTEPETESYKSADDFLQSLEQYEEGKTFEHIFINLTCSREMEKEDGVYLLVLELRKIATNERMKAFLKNTTFSLLKDWEYEKEATVSLSTEMNRLMRNGMMFKRLTFSLDFALFYGVRGDIIEEEVEALMKGINRVPKENLPVLSLPISSHGYIFLLAQCLKVEWPIEEVHFIRLLGNSKTTFDWREIRRMIEGSNFSIRVFKSVIDKGIDLHEVIQAVCSGEGDVEFMRFEVNENVLIFKLLHEARTKHQVKTLRITTGLYLEQPVKLTKSTIEVCAYNTLPFFKSLVKRYSANESAVLQTEEIEITDGLERRMKMQILIKSIVRTKHSLVRFSCGYSLTKDISESESFKQLKKQMNSNLKWKMKTWMTKGSEISYGRRKIMVVGKGLAGKSTTIQSLLGQPFNPKIKSTIVADADKDVSIKVQDVSSTWKETNIDDNWMREEMGEYFSKVKANPDVTKVQSMVENEPLEIEMDEVEGIFKKDDVVDNVYEEVERHERKNQPKKQTNFLDSVGKQMKTYYNSFNVQSRKTNSDEQESARLTIWDFGGQEVFYALHHLYLTSGGLYLLVFNLKLLHEQMEAELRVIEFWIESISLHSPGASVIMVGTRCHKLSTQILEKIDLELRSLIKNKKIQLFEADELCFFPIDNSRSKSIKKQIQPLKATILRCFRTDSEVTNSTSNVWEKKIPLAWIYFMNHLTNRFKGIITANQLFQIADEMELNRERDILPMLEFYKNAGGIIPFTTTNLNDEEAVSDYIVLSPEWLLKIMASFIYEPSLHKTKERFQEDHQLKNLLLNYEETGLLSHNLLLQILMKANVSEVGTDFVLQLSKQMFIMSDFEFQPKWSTSEEDSFYLVPTMNRQLADAQDIAKEASVEDCFNFYIHCQRYIPIGVFERIICIMLSLNKDYGGTLLQPVIKKNFAAFYFREVQIFLENQGENRDFRVAISKEDVVDPNVLLNVIEVVEELLDRLSSDVLGKEMEAQIEFESSGKQQLRCSWKDLRSSVENSEAKKVKVLLPDGTEKLKKISIFNPFSEAADLSLKREQEANEEDQPDLKWEYDAFLAHCWGPNNETHETVVEIARLLKERDVRVWIDETNLKRYISNDIVRGVRTSACILVFITELYLLRVEGKNSNASKEFFQAVAKGGEYLVPVVLDPKCLNPASWSGSLVSYHLKDALYIDFSSEEKIAANMGRLCERISEMSKEQRPRNSFDTEFFSVGSRD